jgi:outer membrane protein OmpA-like peptidoglycan-associated protein
MSRSVSRSALGRAATAQLTALGAELAKPERKGTRLVVAGHTDARGGDEFNERLSKRRAEAVKHVLVEKFGMPDETVVAVGHGKAEPKNAADPFAAENRRVEVSAAADTPAGPR